MAIVKLGGNRQDAHEKLRVLSHEAGARVKQDGAENDLIERIRADDFFQPIWADLDTLLEPQTFTGRAPQQVKEYIASDVMPILARYAEKLDGAVKLTV